LQPSLQLESSVSGKVGPEVYDFPGSFAKLDEGERYARLLLEGREATQHVSRGESTCRTFVSGYRSDANQTYQLLHLQHSAQTSDYRTGEAGHSDYHNSFVAIPHSTPFRPL